MSEKKWTDDERDEAFDRGMETMQRVALELYRRGREPLLEELEEARARNADMRAMLEQVTRERDEARAACPDCAMWAERSARWHEDMQRAERERDEWRDKFLALNQTAGELCNACGWAFKIPGESCRCEVVKERDEARADLARSVAAWESAGMQGRTAHDAMLALAKERDEARAETARLRRLLNMAEDELVAADDHGRREANRADTVEAEVEALKAERDEARAELSKLRKDYDSVLEANVGLLDGAPYVDARAAFRRGAEAMREACARMEPYAYNLDDHLMISKWRSLVRGLSIPEDK